jgi:uncharacterized protein (DUF427 family)
MRAMWSGVVLAQSDETKVVEGNHYFPPDSISHEYFVKSSTHSLCPWKGIASYYTVSVGGRDYRDAAWFYPHPFALARKIKNHVAFYGGVAIVDEEKVR